LVLAVSEEAIYLVDPLGLVPRLIVEMNILIWVLLVNTQNDIFKIIFLSVYKCSEKCLEGYGKTLMN